MQVNDVKRQIQSKRLDSFYVFTGEEIEAQRIYINKISEITNKPIKRIENVTEAFNKRSSLLKVFNVFVCRDDTEFWKRATDLENLNELLGSNILILEMTSIDGRSKASKLYADRIVEFKYMDEDTLYKHVQRQCSLTDENTYDLIYMCERDYSRLLLEIDKIHAYARARDLSADEAFETLVAEGTISRPPQDAIFAFSDAMLRADIGEAFRLLQECKAFGEAPLKIISVLYSNFKRVLSVQICDSKDVCATTGLTAYDVKIARQFVGAWAGEDLVYFLKTLQSIEQKLKTGEVEEENAIDLLMVLML